MRVLHTLMFASPSHTDISDFIPSFPLTIGTGQAFPNIVNADNEITQLTEIKLVRRPYLNYLTYSHHLALNYKENKENVSQLI